MHIFRHLDILSLLLGQMYSNCAILVDTFCWHIQTFIKVLNKVWTMFIYVIQIIFALH